MSDMKKRVAGLERLSKYVGWFCRRGGIANAAFIAHAANHALSLVRDLAAEVERLQISEDNACGRSVQKDKQIATLTAQLADLEREYKILDRDYGEMTEKRNGTFTENEVLRKQIAALQERLEAAEKLILALQVQRNDELAECQTEMELAEAELGGERVYTKDVLAVTRVGKERIDAYFRKEKP